MPRRSLRLSRSVAPLLKSFPALAQGLDIEAELTIHALELNMPIMEVASVYKPRPEGSVSKLHTYRDGFRICWTMFYLLKEEYPALRIGLCRRRDWCGTRRHASDRRDHDGPCWRSTRSSTTRPRSATCRAGSSRCRWSFAWPPAPRSIIRSWQHSPAPSTIWRSGSALLPHPCRLRVIF